MGGVGGKTSFGHFWKHRKSIVSMPSYVDIVCYNCLGGNDTIHDQSLKKHSNKKLKIENWNWNKIHTSALLYVGTKQSSLKILSSLPLLL